MKKYALILAGILLFSTGCTPQENTSTDEVATGEVVSTDETAETPVDDGYVYITIPQNQVRAATQEELEADLPENYEGVTLNEDGSATYKMTKEENEILLNDVKESFELNVNDYVQGDTAIEGFKRVEYTEIGEDVTYYVDKAIWDESKKAATLPVMMGVDIYRMFLGDNREELNPTVHYVDDETGEEIDSITFKEYIEQTGGI